MKNKIVILAAGKGTRMKSEKPKVLTEIKGVSFIGRQLENFKQICDKPIIVVGYKGDDVIDATQNQFSYVWQREQLGTGHALSCVVSEVDKNEIDNIVVVPGDHPLITADTIENLINIHVDGDAVVSMATVSVDDFQGDNDIFYNCGRIVRDENGDVREIVELKDANDEQKNIKEVNVSYYCFDTEWLWDNIGLLSDNNKSKEYYLTDMIKIAVEQGEQIKAFAISNIFEGIGVNDKSQLAMVKKHF